MYNESADAHSKLLVYVGETENILQHYAIAVLRMSSSLILLDFIIILIFILIYVLLMLSCRRVFTCKPHPRKGRRNPNGRYPEDYEFGDWK